MSIDDRGKLVYFNDFDFSQIKRFYVVENHRKGFVRAWHGHKLEAKYVYVVSGAAIVAFVPLKDKFELTRHVLSADKPQILCVPPGNYNGFKTLTDDAKVMFFSTSTLEESKNDDFRMENKWKGIWEIKER